MIPGRILFGSDFSRNSGIARRYAVEYSVAFNAELMVLHVINASQIGYPTVEDWMPPDLQASLKSIRESVDKALHLVADECRKSAPLVTVHSAVGVPPTEIVRFANENDVKLIVLGTHGWSGIQHLIMGSTAENVVRSADCPVLTVRSSSEKIMSSATGGK